MFVYGYRRTFCFNDKNRRQNRPQFSCTQAAHSCVGGNLTVSYRQITPKSHTSSSFLRRQESLSHLPPTAVSILAEWRILADCCRYDTVRFLPSQEWSVGGRECAGVFWHCAEGLSPWRFLPSQEWSVGNSAVLPIRPIVAASKSPTPPNCRPHRRQNPPLLPTPATRTAAPTTRTATPYGRNLTPCRRNPTPCGQNPTPFGRNPCPTRRNRRPTRWNLDNSEVSHQNFTVILSRACMNPPCQTKQFCNFGAQSCIIILRTYSMPS